MVRFYNNPYPHCGLLELINFQRLIVAIVLTIIFIALFVLQYAWTFYKSKKYTRRIQV